MPEFRSREPLHQEWKRRVLAGEEQVEEVDLTPFTTQAIRERRLAAQRA